MQIFRELRREGLFNAWKSFYFCGHFAVTTGGTSGHTPTGYTSVYVVLAKIVPFRVRQMKFEI